MDLNYFKDLLFDLLNDSEEMNVLDIEADDKMNLFYLSVADGSAFEIQVKSRKKRIYEEKVEKR